jgi:alkanesulfonate monooxygenase SsuD/methylene tetrahydromethanopterin reductase-like flavin-dependent oxidoreductase (luciferase family)
MSERRYWGFVNAMPAPIIGALAQQAEARGLEGLFAPQVYGPPWVPLAAAAASTERVKLASGIAIAAVRSPFETAMAAIDMDRVSSGRFILGLGASVQSWTRGIFGAGEHKPIAHLRETVAAVRHIPFEGEYFNADFRELQPTAPPLREEIPVWIAALRGPAVRLAAEVADGLMGHPIWSLAWAERPSHLVARLGRAATRCGSREGSREGRSHARPARAQPVAVVRAERRRAGRRRRRPRHRGVLCWHRRSSRRTASSPRRGASRRR